MVIQSFEAQILIINFSPREQFQNIIQAFISQHHYLFLENIDDVQQAGNNIGLKSLREMHTVEDQREVDQTHH